MASNVAFTSEQLDMARVEEYYADLEINAKEHFENKKRAALFKAKIRANEFRQEVNSSDWKLLSAVVADVNAYFNPTGNMILYPAARLQGFFYSDERPMVMNFGATGSVYGHELTHGFDDQGKKFDWEGNLEDWWQPETETKY